MVKQTLPTYAAGMIVCMPRRRATPMASQGFRTYHAVHFTPFRDVPPHSHLALFSECCLFSLATLEVDCDPETRSFALTEQERPGAWRWAVINDRSVILQAGCEPTQVEAKKIAAEALHYGSMVTNVNAVPS